MLEPPTSFRPSHLQDLVRNHHQELVVLDRPAAIVLGVRDNLLGLLGKKVIICNISTSTSTILCAILFLAPIMRFVFVNPEGIPPPPFCNTFVKITAVVPPLV